jgi:hypothetical protein
MTNNAPIEPLVASDYPCLFAGRNACGARLKRTVGLCRQPAMKNGRCRLHGGKSTGPKTPQGKANSAKANYKHGGFTKQAMAQHRALMAVIKDCNRALKTLG